LFFLAEDLPDQINIGLAGLPGVCHQLLRVVDGGDTVHISVQNPNWTPAQTQHFYESGIYLKATCCIVTGNFSFPRRFFKTLLKYISKHFVNVSLSNFFCNFPALRYVTLWLFVKGNI
jgi:hypothetical protein